jgi:hypothetical protein
LLHFVFQRPWRAANARRAARGGKITLNSAGNTTSLIIGTSSVTLSGGGTLTLTDSANPQNFIVGASGTDTLTNQETIQGSGNIGNSSMGLINSGIILANGTHTLFIQPSSSGFTNNGTLQAASGSTMHVEGGPFTNFSASTLKGGTYNVSGTLEIDQLGSGGGEILTNAANIILNGAASNKRRSSRFLESGDRTSPACGIGMTWSGQISQVASC